MVTPFLPLQNLQTYLGLAAQAEDAEEIREQVASLQKRLRQVQ